MVCHLMNDRHKSSIVGVGQQQTIGKIDAITVSMNGCPMDMSLVVVDSFHSNYFLIGQDFLKRNHCIVYCNEKIVFFKKNRLLVKTKTI